MAHDVFISYSSQDKPIADAVCAGLEASGIRCWIAPRDVQPGLSFAGEIKRAIQRSKIMALIFSAHSNTSEQVLREVQLAANSRLHIVQFRIENVNPNDDLEYYLSAPHWLDAITPPVEMHIQQLETSLKALLQLSKPLPETAGLVSDFGARERPDGVPSLAEKPTIKSEQASAAGAPQPAARASPVPVEISPPRRKRVPWKVMAGIGVLVVTLIAVVLALLVRHPTSSSPAPSASAPARGDIATNSSSATFAPSVAPGRNDSGRNPAFTFVDMDRAFKNYNKTKEAEAKINEEKNASKKEYDQRADAYKAKLNAINAMAAGRARDQSVSEIKAMEKEINDWRNTREKELQDKASKRREAIVKEITAEISQLDHANSNLIVDSSGNSLNGVPLFIVNPGQADMSDRVISGLNNNSRDMFVAVRSLRFALVDMNDTFKRYFKTKDAETKINDAKNAAKREYDDRADAYKAKLDAINKMANGTSRNHAISEIKAMEKEINEFRTTREKQLQEQASRFRGDIVKDIENLIREMCAKDGQAIVLDVSGQSVNGRWAVFFQGIPDLTNDIVADLNQQNLTRSGNVSFASTENLRFGQVNMDRAFKALPERPSAEAEIQAAKDRAKSELGEHPDAAAKAAKEKELQSLTVTKRNALIDRIVGDVAVVAKNAGFNIVFDVTGQSTNAVPVAIASRDIPDLTDQVIADLGGSVAK